MYSNVLIGVDHHDGGRDAVALAQQWFARGAELTLAHISTDDPYVYRGASAQYASSERELGLVRLEDARDEGASAGRSSLVRSFFGRARAARAVRGGLGADLLVIGCLVAGGSVASCWETTREKRSPAPRAPWRSPGLATATNRTARRRSASATTGRGRAGMRCASGGISRRHIT